jgi:hypothetical protein
MSTNDPTENPCANCCCEKRAEAFVDVKPYPGGLVQDFPASGVPFCTDCADALRHGTMRIHWVVPRTPGKYLYLVRSRN